MNRRHFALASLAAILCAGCEPTPPTEADGRAALEGILRSKFPNIAFNVKDFRKTNGVSKSPMYQMYYVATIEFPNGVAPAAKGFWNDFMASGDVQARLMLLTNKGFKITEGDSIRQRTVMQANSAITFVK